MERKAEKEREGERWGKRERWVKRDKGRGSGVGIENNQLALEWYERMNLEGSLRTLSIIFDNFKHDNNVIVNTLSNGT